jgi:hypothetical protein
MKFILTTEITGKKKSEIETHFELWHIISSILHKVQYDKLS